MNRHLELAPRRSSVPVPIVEENTIYFQAGPILFGVEHRRLNQQVFDEHMANTPGAAEAWENRPWKDDAEMNKLLQLGFGVEGEPPPENEGVSIHVLDRASHDEFLRFDAFAKDPHYHYISPHDPHHVVIFFDEVAEPDYISWVMGRLRSRLPAMLEDAGGGAVAVEVERDYDEVVRILPDVEVAARERASGIAKSRPR